MENYKKIANDIIKSDKNQYASDKKYLNYIDEKIVLEILRLKPHYLNYISNPSKDMIQISLDYDVNILFNIRINGEEMELFVIKRIFNYYEKNKYQDVLDYHFCSKLVKFSFTNFQSYKSLVLLEDFLKSRSASQYINELKKHPNYKNQAEIILEEMKN